MGIAPLTTGGFLATSSLPMQLAREQVLARDAAMIGATREAGQARFESMLQSWFVAGRKASEGWIRTLSPV